MAASRMPGALLLLRAEVMLGRPVSLDEAGRAIEAALAAGIAPSLGPLTERRIGSEPPGKDYASDGRY
jgi:hypothetical protein